MVGIDARNKNTLDEKFICPCCKLILCDPFQFNTCGHRQCRSCFPIKNGTTIKCAQCQTETTSSEIMIDRGFKHDMEYIPIICSFCNWTDTLKDYQEHLDQSHPNPKCDYCHQHFDSINQLNQHKLFQCQMITKDCLLKDFGCNQQILQSQLLNHYQSKEHQQSILNVIQQMKSQLRDAQMTSNQMDIDTSQTTTTIENNNVINQLEELYETFNILASGSETLNEDTQRLNVGLVENEMKLQNLIENIPKVKSSIEEENVLLEGISRNLDILNQELMSIKEKMGEVQYVSHDGTFTWKITQFNEKILNAQSERQTSIYSPPFYSSPVGYKIRARLYLNGNGRAQRTYMSLFFVLMGGPNDAILKFPFNYKVTFCLYDQTPQLRHIIDSFQPDIRSSSFQRPRSEMNIASGIPKFFPLAMILQDGNPYVRDDTMFIKIMVDFGDMSKALLPFAFSLNPGIPTNIQQIMIKQEAERQADQKRQEELRLNNSICIPNSRGSLT